MLMGAASSSGGIHPLTTSCIPSQFAAEAGGFQKSQFYLLWQWHALAREQAGAGSQQGGGGGRKDRETEVQAQAQVQG